MEHGSILDSFRTATGKKTDIEALSTFTNIYRDTRPYCTGFNANDRSVCHEKLPEG